MLRELSPLIPAIIVAGRSGTAIATELGNMKVSGEILALTSLGIWDDVAPKVAQADNVRAALALVSTGEAPLGIVYRTDANADANVTVIGTFPPDSHPPIVYPAAVTA